MSTRLLSQDINIHSDFFQHWNILRGGGVGNDFFNEKARHFLNFTFLSLSEFSFLIQE